MKSRIMYIERKAGSLTGAARIGRVTFNRSMKTIRYRDQVFHRVSGYKYNHVEENTGEYYWISGCKKRGGDQLYATNVAVEIDDDAREEYWSEIRNLPEERHRSTT